ncbi:MAG: carbohydrate kinase family protein [Oscillospiraceae bacterium]|nr:carbohydrate kinase family protein [Oscillospiraceae bacterium]
MKTGIAVGGNIFVDYLKQIDFYPGEGMLTKIRAEGRSVGGCVSNTGISLKRLSPSLAVKGVSCIGRDDAGKYVLDTYKKNGLDISNISMVDNAVTGYTDVFSSKSGTRTFFVNQGTNAVFDLKHIDFDRLDAKILHIGYILLLERMDSGDDEYGTVLARVLNEAKRLGVKTSIDIVSEDGDRFRSIVPASLKHSDYVIINEIEAGRTVGISPRNPDGTLIFESLPVICEKLMDFGISDCVIIHCPETGIFMDNKRRWTGMRSLELPKGYIKGSVGAGDAFCAGALLGLYSGMSPEEILRLANSAAAGCLSFEGGTDGVGTKEQMLELHEKYAVSGEVWTT